MHKPTKVTPNADDIAAIQNLRETLLAQNWPDSEAVGKVLRSKGGRIFGVWTGRDGGGYRYPPFQFLKGGSVHPQLSELMDALARQPNLNPSHDKSGWERAFWLYLPRGRLSLRALSLRAADFQEVQENPERFAVLPDDARTPAEVFPDDCQAVIDLANDDADHGIPDPPRNNG